MQNFDEFNDNRVFNHITRLFGRFTIDFVLRILQSVNHALAIGLGFLTSAYVQDSAEANTENSWRNIVIMGTLSVLVSYLIEYVRHYAGEGYTSGHAAPYAAP